MPKRLTQEEYESRLAVFGKAVCLESYQGNNVKIKHKCLIHEEIHLAIPGDLLNGHGMSCCSLNHSNRVAAKARYDERLKKIGIATRIEEYQSRRKPILHRCIIHGTKFLQEPRRALEGRLPPCCSKLSRGSIYHMLLAPERWSKHAPCNVYIFSMARFKGLVKIGIAIKLGQRSSDPEYGDFVSCWQRDNRFEAYLIEQAVLQDQSLEAYAPDVLRETPWAGWTEIRKCSNPEAVKVVQFYVDKMNDLGVHRFILEFMDPSRAEADLCLEVIRRLEER